MNATLTLAISKSVSSCCLPAGVPTAPLSVVPVHDSADEETGPAQPGHRRGS